MSLTIRIDADAKVGLKLRRAVVALRATTRLHQRVAVAGEELTKAHLRRQNSEIAHRSARGVGAPPSQHLAKIANQIESFSSEDSATLRLPRRSRLRAAFGTYTVRPTGGRKMLTIPAHASTYGRNARDFSGLLKSALIGGRYPALVFRKTGTAAFWLAKQVTIKEDRSLLPFDQYEELIVEEARGIVREALAATPEGGQS